MNILKLLRIGLPVIAIVMVLAYSIGYLAGQGTLAITINGKGSYTYYQLSDDIDAPTATKNKSSGSTEKTVASGTYVVQYTDDSGSAVKYVTVPGFFGTGEANFTAVAQQQVERLAYQTASQLATNDKGTIYGISTTIGDPVTAYDTNQPLTIGKAITQTIDTKNSALVNNKLIGFLGVTTGRGRVAEAPIVYDFVTAKSTALDRKYDPYDTTLSFISPSVASTDTFGVSYTKDKKLYVDIFSGTRYKNTFEITDTVLADEGKTAAITDKYIAVGTGSDSVDNHDALEGSEAEHRFTEKDYVLDIYDISEKNKVRSLNIGKRSVDLVRLSPDATYAAVTRGNTVFVYNTDNGKEVFAFEQPLVATMSWLDDNRLVLSSLEKGIYIVDARDRSAQTVFSNRNLRISGFNIVNDQILFSAYSDGIGFTNAANPDAYVAHLNRKAGAGGNDLVTKLPYKTNSFSMYAFQKKIYIRSLTPPIAPSNVPARYQKLAPTANDYRRDAQKYLEDTIKDYRQYTLVYDNSPQ